MAPVKSARCGSSTDGQCPLVPRAGDFVLVGLGYSLGEAEQESSSSSGSSGSVSARIGDKHPLNVDAEELVLEWRSVQASISSPPTPITPLPAGLPCSGDPCITGPPSSRPIPTAPALFRLTRPLLFTYLVLLSMDTVRLRGPLPIFPPSGLSIHQELFPVPSF